MTGDSEFTVENNQGDNDDEMWTIVVYIRHLPRKGSLGEPCLYTGECPAPAPAAK